MRIIHCADLHLDSKMTSNLTREKAKERKAELLNTFDRMLRYAVQNQVEAILIAGDLFDTKNVSAGARNAVRDGIINHPNITFYYLKGNHDADSFLGSLDEIPDNLKLFDDEWTTYSLDEGRITVTGVELIRDNSGSIYNDLALDMECFNILMLHGQESETASKDDAEVINLRKLKNRGIDYLALGHIHAFKLETLDSRGKYCYPGCLEGRGFDECGEHGFVLLDIDPEEGDFQQTFIPMAERCLYTLEVDVSQCMTTADISDRIRSVLDGEKISGQSLLKLVLVGNVDVECEKNIDFLVKKFEPEYYFLKIADETELKVDYRAFAHDESLKGEFVRLVERAEDLDPEQKAAVIRYGIRALAGEEID